MDTKQAVSERKINPVARPSRQFRPDGAVGGREGVKLEDQVLITEQGCENLTRFPFEDALLGIN